MAMHLSAGASRWIASPRGNASRSPVVCDESVRSGNATQALTVQTRWSLFGDGADKSVVLFHLEGL